MRFLVEDSKVVGVRTATHQEYAAKAVIVTTGTALRGEIPSSETLSTSLGSQPQLGFY